MTKNQIADTLNKLFLEDGERIVFWEDGDGAFVEDVDDLELDDVVKWRLPDVVCESVRGSNHRSRRSHVQAGQIAVPLVAV